MIRLPSQFGRILGSKAKAVHEFFNVIIKLSKGLWRFKRFYHLSNNVSLDRVSPITL